jgi:hypothetical protein
MSLKIVSKSLEEADGDEMKEKRLLTRLTELLSPSAQGAHPCVCLLSLRSLLKPRPGGLLYSRVEDFATVTALVGTLTSIMRRDDGLAYSAVEVVSRECLPCGVQCAPLSLTPPRLAARVDNIPGDGPLDSSALV